MAETKGTKSAIEDWENICKGYVKMGIAELLVDSKGDSKNYIRVYNVFVGSGIDFKKVCWRFHYDERIGGKSSLRISDRGMEVMTQSMTIMAALRKLNMKFSNGDRYDLNKLSSIMNEALVIIENREKEGKHNEIIAKSEEAS